MERGEERKVRGKDSSGREERMEVGRQSGEGARSVTASDSGEYCEIAQSQIRTVHYQKIKFETNPVMTIS
jgi:hypothetical protein